MATKKQVQEALARGFNVRATTCKCPRHRAGATTFIGQEMGKIVPHTETNYRTVCMECFKQFYDGVQNSPQAGQNSFTGLEKVEVETGLKAQFTFYTSRADIMQSAKISWYGVQAQGRGYLLTSPIMNNLNGVSIQWKAWGVPHNTKVTWKVFNQAGQVIAQGTDTPKVAVKQARLNRGTI